MKKDLLNREYVVLNKLDSPSLVYSAMDVNDDSKVCIISTADALERNRLRNLKLDQKHKWAGLLETVQASERYLEVRRRGAWVSNEYGETTNHAVAVYEPFVCTLAEALAPLRTEVTQKNSNDLQNAGPLMIGERLDMRVDRAETVREYVRLLKSWHDENDEAAAAAARKGEQFTRKPLAGSRVGFLFDGEGSIQMKILPFEINDPAADAIGDEAELEEWAGKPSLDRFRVKTMLDNFMQVIEAEVRKPPSKLAILLGKLTTQERLLIYNLSPAYYYMLMQNFIDN